MRAESLGGLQDNQCPSDMYLCSIPIRDRGLQALVVQCLNIHGIPMRMTQICTEETRWESQFELYQLDQYTSVQS